jgi:hypothetical protein
MASRLHDTAAPADRRLDWAGQVLAIIALGGVTLAVIEADPLGATNPLVLGRPSRRCSRESPFQRSSGAWPSRCCRSTCSRHGGLTSAVIFGLIVNLSFYGIVFVLGLYLQQVGATPRTARDFGRGVGGGRTWPGGRARCRARGSGTWVTCAGGRTGSSRTRTRRSSVAAVNVCYFTGPRYLSSHVSVSAMSCGRGTSCPPS